MTLILDAASVGVIHTRLGTDVVVNHPVGFRVSTLAENGLVDVLISDSEDGFSQLGGMRQFLSSDLGLHERNQAKWALDGFPAKLEKNISSIADWNRSRNEVTLVAIPSARSDGFLKGLVLAAYEGCVSYRKFVPAMRYGRPYRDFMYNVTYESIAFAYHAWGARKIGVTHLSCAASGYRRDITTCQIEAMIHFCNEHDEVESFTFVDERDGNKPLEILTEFQQLEDAGSHRNITRTIQEHWGTTFVDLDWTKV